MIGRTVSHYKILETLGEGGMGLVFKARDTRLDRVVALKFLPWELTQDAESKKRFIQEARAASALSHPNIATIYEIGQSEEGTYIAMEFVEGGSLKEKLRQGKLDFVDAVDIALQIGEGLKEAHERGIVHRDIKSENILVSVRGRAKIIDFGVAKLLGKAERSDAGLRIGTIAWMSPEQLLGKDVDHRTDIWSLGVVLYEMLTGRLPFAAEYEDAVVYSILHTEPVPLATFRLDIPELAERVIRKALEKEREKRYQSVDSFLMELRTLSELSGQLQRRRVSIVVLPFEDISRGRDNEYFSDGLTEELIMNLSRLKDLSVISRTTAMQYKGRKGDIRTIGRELDVRYVLEGSVRKSDEGLLISAQLVDVETDTHLWSGKYRGELAQVFVIQEQVSKQIVDALMVKLSPTEKRALAKRPTENPEAFDYHLRARNALYRMTKSDVKSSIQLFLRAIELDERYAAAHAGLGEAYGWLYLYFERKDSHLDMAVAACMKALMYDPALSEAYAALGMAYFDKNMLNEALTAVEKAIELDPNSFIAYWILGRIYRTHGRDREAIEPFKKVIALNPDFYAVYMDLKTVYEKLGETELHAAALRSELEVYPRYIARFPEDPRAHIFYAVALAQAGRSEEGKVEAAKAIELNPTDPLMLYNAACFYSRLGEKRLALEALRSHVAAGAVNFEWIKRDPDIDNIRDEPEYREIMKGR